MTRTATEPTLTGDILRRFREVGTRLGLLERRIAALVDRKEQQVLRFSQDTLAVSTSGADTFEQGATAYELEIMLEGTTTGTTTARVLRNGSSIGSVSISGGSDSGGRGKLTTTKCSPTDRIQVDVTAAGTFSGDCRATYRIFGR